MLGRKVPQGGDTMIHACCFGDDAVKKTEFGVQKNSDRSCVFAYQNPPCQDVLDAQGRGGSVKDPDRERVSDG